MSTEIRATLGDLVAAEEALERVAALRLPVKAAYHVAKLVRLVRAETLVFHQQREAHIRDLGETRGDQISVKPEHWADFQQRMRELAAIPVSLAWAPITLEMFANEAVTPADLLALGPLVEAEGQNG